MLTGASSLIFSNALSTWDCRSSILDHSRLTLVGHCHRAITELCGKEVAGAFRRQALSLDHAGWRQMLQFCGLMGSQTLRLCQRGSFDFEETDILGEEPARVDSILLP